MATAASARWKAADLYKGLKFIKKTRLPHSTVTVRELEGSNRKQERNQSDIKGLKVGSEYNKILVTNYAFPCSQGH